MPCLGFGGIAWPNKLRTLPSTFLVINVISIILLHCALASCGAVYCKAVLSVGICLFVYLCLCGCLCVLWVCYHDNSKLRALILTKLGL